MKAKKRTLYAKLILRKIFFEDWPMKLIALAITLGLWLAVTGLSTPTTTRFSHVPLNIVTPPNTEITNPIVQTVDIVVSGDARRINRMAGTNLGASLDLTDMQPGERTVILSPSNVFVGLETGVKLDEITPNNLVLRLENISERDVAVKVETSGAIDPDLEVYSKVVNPPRVSVRGPESLVRGLDSVSTEKIDLDGRTGDFTARQVLLAPTNSKAAVRESAVDVFFRIGERRVERVVTIPVSGSTSAKRVTVTLYGPKSVLAALKPETLKAEIVKDSNIADDIHVTLPDDLAQTIQVRKTKLN